MVRAFLKFLLVILVLPQLVIVWHAQPWPPRISFIQVFDKFDGSHDKNFLLPSWLWLALRKSTAIKLVRNLSKTCTKLMQGCHDWTRKTVKHRFCGYTFSKLLLFLFLSSASNAASSENFVISAIIQILYILCKKI